MLLNEPFEQLIAEHAEGNSALEAPPFVIFCTARRRPRGATCPARSDRLAVLLVREDDVPLDRCQHIIERLGRVSALLGVPVNGTETTRAAPTAELRFRAMRGKKIIIAAGAVVLAGCGVPSQTASPSTVTVTYTMQPTITETQTVTYTPPWPKTTIETEGIYVVGTDIAPGTWREPGGSACYWARLRSLDTSDIIDNSNSDGPQVVEIQPSDKAFQTRGCATWTKTDRAPMSALRRSTGWTHSATPETRKELAFDASNSTANGNDFAVIEYRPGVAGNGARPIATVEVGKVRRM